MLSQDTDGEERLGAGPSQLASAPLSWKAELKVGSALPA